MCTILCCLFFLFGCFIFSPIYHTSSVQFSSVAQSCPTLCDPMDCRMPGFPVHHQRPELTHSCPSNWWYHTISLWNRGAACFKLKTFSYKLLMTSLNIPPFGNILILRNLFLFFEVAKTCAILLIRMFIEVFIVMWKKKMWENLNVQWLGMVLKIMIHLRRTIKSFRLH